MPSADVWQRITGMSSKRTKKLGWQNYFCVPRVSSPTYATLHSDSPTKQSTAKDLCDTATEAKKRRDINQHLGNADHDVNKLLCDNRGLPRVRISCDVGEDQNPPRARAGHDSPFVESCPQTHQFLNHVHKGRRRHDAIEELQCHSSRCCVGFLGQRCSWVSTLTFHDDAQTKVRATKTRNQRQGKSETLKQRLTGAQTLDYNHTVPRRASKPSQRFATHTHITKPKTRKKNSPSMCVIHHVVQPLPP